MLLVILCLLFFYIFYRNEKLYHFHNHIINLCDEYDLKKNIEEESAILWFYDKKIPNWIVMLFHYKSFTLKNWFSKEDINKLYR
jgi:hypothetical protein